MNIRIATEVNPVMSLSLIAKAKGQNISSKIKKDNLLNSKINDGIIFPFISKLLFCYILADFFESVIALAPFSREHDKRNDC